MSNELTVVQPRQLAEVDRQHGPLDVTAVINRIALIQQVMRGVMKPDVHYGVIPGTNKPSLFKPGAETLCATFQFAATFPNDRIHRILEKDLILYEVTCVLVHIPTGNVVGEGVGLCSSREDKYAFRKGSLTCPKCGVESLIQGSEKYGGGWLCWKKKGGCGTKWPENNAFDPKAAAKVPVENIFEQANTILKMAEKRAMIAAALVATGASDIFTQDIEDFVEPAPGKGYGESGSKEAAQEVAAQKIAAHKAATSPDIGAPVTPADAPPVAAPGRESAVASVGPLVAPADPAAHDDIREDPIGVDYQEVAGQSKTPLVMGKAKITKLARYPGIFDDLKRFEKAKEQIGEETYYTILSAYGVPHANFFADHAQAAAALNAMREAYTAKRKKELHAAEAEGGGMLYSDERVGPTEEDRLPKANYAYSVGKKAGYGPKVVDEWFAKFFTVIGKAWPAAIAQFDQEMSR